MTFGRFSPKNGLFALFSTVGREFFPFFLAPRDFFPVLYRCLILLYRQKTVRKGIKNIRFFRTDKKRPPVSNRKFLFYEPDSGTIILSFTETYPLVRKRAKTQARQRSAPLFHGRVLTYVKLISSRRSSKTSNSRSARIPQTERTTPYATERKRKRDNEVRRFFTDKFLRMSNLFPRGVRQKQAIREARGFRKRSVQHRTRRSENASATTKCAAFSRTPHQ